MKFPTEAQIARMRKQYPAGTMIRLHHMGNDPRPIPDGTIGKVVAVDDAGNILMHWDNGRSLSLIESEDSFTILPRCPKCGKQYAEHPAISREDGETNICPECGMIEALEDFKKYLDGIGL